MEMKDVARALGVELEEEFIVKDYNNTYKLTEDGLVHWSDDYQVWIESCILEDLLKGDVKITKLSFESILTGKEKEYLSSVIKPFRNRVSSISKHFNSGPLEYITISLDCDDFAILPTFKEGTAYKGMKLCKKYTLEELDL